MMCEVTTFDCDVFCFFSDVFRGRSGLCCLDFGCCCRVLTWQAQLFFLIHIPLLSLTSKRSSLLLSHSMPFFPLLPPPPRFNNRIHHGPYT